MPYKIIESNVKGVQGYRVVRLASQGRPRHYLSKTPLTYKGAVAQLRAVMSHTKGK